MFCLLFFGECPPSSPFAIRFVSGTGERMTWMVTLTFWPLFRLPPNPRQHTRGCTYHFHPLPHIIPQPTISAFKYLRVGEEARTFIDTIKDALDARVVREVFLGRAPSTSRLRWDRSPSNRVCNDSLSSIFLKKNLTLKLFEVFI